MWKALTFSFRTLRRSPMFTGVAVLSLALGIGANTAIFSLLDQVVLRSLPVSDPQRLMVLHTEYNAPGSSTSDDFESTFSYPMYRDLRDHDPAFSGVIARGGARIALSWRGNAEPAGAEVVSGNFFSTLGVRAAVGRVLTPADDGAPGAHPVAVLSHAYWQSHFGGSPAILNQTITVNGYPVTVIGVAEPRFHGLVPGNACELYLPIAMQRACLPTWDVLEKRRFRWLNVFAKLKPGTTISRAQAATNVVYRSILETELAGMPKMRSERGRSEFLNHRVEVRPAAQGINELGRNWGKPLKVLMAMVGLVLLIACANVASLMLARAAGRQREIAIRLAMGASRWALVKQLIPEGLILALAGGALGLIVGQWSTEGLIRLIPADDVGAWLKSDLDLRVLGFSLALSTACGLLFALIPAFQAGRSDVAVVLKNQAVNTASAGGPARFRKALVATQVALSLLLVVGAGLFTGTLVNLMKTNLGFRSEHLLTFSVDATLSRPALAGAVAFYRDLQNRLTTVPGVSGVGAAAGGPFSGSNRGGNLTVEGYQHREDEEVDGSQVATGAGFFRAMSIPLRSGREFNDRDDGATPKVVVINEAFAKKYFAGRNPIGLHLQFGASTPPRLDREIVGVAADVRNEVREPAKETVYFPYAQWDQPERLSFYLRTGADDARVGPEVRRALRSLDTTVPMGRLDPVNVLIRELIYMDRLIALLSVAFGALATVLAAIGLYGVVAFAVTRRTAEIGIRMALGARPYDVLRMILLEAGGTVAAGIVAGLVAAAALSRLAASQLFGVTASDPIVFAGAAGLLTAVALAAALIPGWRAARIDPVSALKYE